MTKDKKRYTDTRWSDGRYEVFDSFTQLWILQSAMLTESSNTNNNCSNNSTMNDCSSSYTPIDSSVGCGDY